MDRFGIFLFLFLASPGGGAGPVEPGFTPLFNGKDLGGWAIENQGKFSVKDGVIFLDRGDGWLRSDQQYQDFELRLEFRFINKGADSGILFRAGREGKNWPAKTYQVQTMDNESIAGLYATALTRPNVKRDVGLMRKLRKGAGEWQSYAITVTGARAEIKLNGALVTVADGLTVRPGYLGLKGQGGQLEFKNLRIRELK
ncbi:MAG: DUF1080 domain-containing protein [Gemmataceae bacterium]|nr:DUF1080 domain-containing protein [Gemmataceae bacterium]